jgi:hypothetical protein
MSKKKLLKLIVLVTFLIWSFQIYKQISEYRIDYNLKDTRNVNIDGSQVFESSHKCNCRSEKIYLNKKSHDTFEVIATTDERTKLLYTLTDSQYENLRYVNCDLFNVLRRGPSQKVIGYSLYGSNRYYYESIANISKLNYNMYPGWVMRVHHDDTVDKSIICELECLKNENGVYADNIDFCQVTEIPFGASINQWNAAYMHAMSWRWLPLGDRFVDYFMSRDTDAWPNQREHISVKLWLQSNNLFHIMRGFFY